MIKSKGLQFGKYNISIDTYAGSGGVGLTLRDTSRAKKAKKQRIFGIDYHGVKRNGVIKNSLHYHIGVGKKGKVHKFFGFKN